MYLFYPTNTTETSLGALVKNRIQVLLNKEYDISVGMNDKVFLYLEG